MTSVCCLPFCPSSRFAIVFFAAPAIFACFLPIHSYNMFRQSLQLREQSGLLRQALRTSQRKGRQHLQQQQRQRQWRQRCVGGRWQKKGTRSRTPKNDVEHRGGLLSMTLTSPFISFSPCLSSSPLLDLRRSFERPSKRQASDVTLTISSGLMASSLPTGRFAVQLLERWLRQVRRPFIRETGDWGGKWAVQSDQRRVERLHKGVQTDGKAVIGNR